MRILIVNPPWITGRSEREAFARTGTALGPGSEVLDITGNADAAALAERVASLLEAGARQLVLLPAGPAGETAAALIAARAAVRALGRCTLVQVEGGKGHARRAVFGGRAELVLDSDAAITCATLRPDASASAPAPQARSIAMDAAPAFEAQPVPTPATHPRVEGASMVVSGGRGIGAPEGFDLLACIANLLGAGLGGSLPAVDAGWVPVAHQVGQSGKFVSPKVYFAVAISGTPQHLAGVAPSARIVALNSDKEAPIFQRCDVGVVGDWREILPLVAEELERTASAAD